MSYTTRLMPRISLTILLETRSRKRVSMDQLAVETHLGPEPADLVLEKLPERLDHLQVHPLGQSSHVVMRLDRVRRPFHRLRLDQVGIERPLPQEPDLAPA